MEKIGNVTHYFSKISVAVLAITGGSLKVGDEIHIKGHTSDMTFKVDSLQVDHKPVESAKAGDDIAIKVPDHVREHDEVFKVG
ncbi:hypothetical protein JXB02_04315 [Candidatus Woesearchaeota archaeon]|nr:hypothetical protein [Candidatus Woesearchaeota archaeon]